MNRLYLYMNSTEEKMDATERLKKRIENIEKTLQLLVEQLTLLTNGNKEEGRQENEQNDTALIVKHLNKLEKRISKLDKKLDKKFAENERKFDEKLEKINRRIKDIERDQRTDKSIASAVRSMGIFENTPQSLSGNRFTEELNDIYG
ncbi:MAG: hypothetical protein D3914_02830 [Candidatus Electrothrix sp. LOE2]|nr:hypothetical protein [Candidatus Electrothrix sp. LOE2]